MTEARDLDKGRAWLLARLDAGAHPLDGLDPQAYRAAFMGRYPTPDGGHMGEGPVVPTIGQWLDRQLT